jgi:hypothetical protein
MGNNLYAASRQWAERPADERFESLQELYDATRRHFETSGEAKGVQLRALKVEPTGDNDLRLVGPTGANAAFTDYSFRQLCGRIQTPSKYLATLPSDLAAKCVQHGIDRLPGDAETNLFFHQNGGLVFRGMNSDMYQRIWNWEVAEFCQTLQSLDSNWRVPPARPAGKAGERVRIATEADVLDMNSNFGLSVKVGDAIAPAGLYASAHDVFVFMVNQDRRVEVGNGEVLNRGFFISGSEVAGVSTHKITMFLYDNVCGNHIVWGAQDVVEVSFRHVGMNMRALVAEAYAKMRTLADADTADDNARVQAARTLQLEATKDKVIDLVFHKGLFTRKQAELVYAKAEEFESVHGDPRTAWGLAAGATRLSQDTPYTDVRNDLDRAAGKLLQLVEV